MWQQMFGRRGVPTEFVAEYRCYPVAMIEKPQLESGDKVVLPPSALEQLSRMETDYPMLFNVRGTAERSTHCGVMEFSAPEGLCYMPYWMMQSLMIQEGGFVRVKNVSLKKANFVKFRPMKKTFLDISNPKAVLEKALRKYTCMTVGDQIYIEYNDQQYYIDVQEVRPDGQACIVETDMEVDFAPPADYVEPDWKALKAAEEAKASAEAGAAAAFGGASSAPPPAAGGAAAAAAPVETPSFAAFSGAGCRIDGKSAAESSGPVASAAAAAATAPRVAATSAAAPAVPSFAGAGSGFRIDGKAEVRAAPPMPPPPVEAEKVVSGLARGRRNRRKLAPRRGFLDKLEAQQKSMARGARNPGRVTKAFGGKGQSLG